jgi:hypothetical protein
VARDVRVDRIGYAREIVELWAEPMKAEVKAKMLASKLVLVEGDRYQGRLAESAPSTVDPGKFYDLMSFGRISKAEFISAIRVNKEAAGQFLSPKDLDAISTPPAVAVVSLTITRIKGIDVPLREAIEGVVKAAAV